MDESDIRDIPVPTRTVNATVNVNASQTEDARPWALTSFRTRHWPRLPWIQDNWHAQIRPFYRALAEHRPQHGAVRYVGLDTGRKPVPQLLTSIVDTNNGPAGDRFLGGGLHIFPGWGRMPVRRLGPGPDPEPHPVDHITIEEDGNGRLRAHLSARRTKGGHKPTIADTTALKEPDGPGAHTLTLLIRDPSKLDITGNAWCHVPEPQRVPAGNLQRELAGSFLPDHPIVELPLRTPWEPGNHLQIHLTLTDSDLQPDRYASTVRNPDAFAGSPPTGDGPERRLTRIPLRHGRSIVLVVEQVEGTPESDAVLLLRRLHPHPTP